MTGPSNRQILALAIPALGALAADPLLSLVDTAFVGRLGPVPLAALGIDVAIFGFAFALFNFLAYATTPLVARARGMGDIAGAGHVVSQAFTLAASIGAAVGVALIVAAPVLVSLFGPEPNVVGPALEYLRIRAVALPAMLVMTAGHGAYRGMQDTRTPLVLALVVNVLNAVLDPLFMFWGGLELAGAAVATLIAQWIGAVAFVILLRRRAGVEGWRFGRIPLGQTRGLARVGSLLVIRTLLLVGSLAVATATATRMGTVTVAAHQIVSQIWFLLAMMVDALAIAAQALVADLAGRDAWGAARGLSRRLHVWGLIAGVFLGLMLWTAAAPIGRLFTVDRSVLAALEPAMGIAALMQPVAALVFVADGVLMALVELRTLAVSTAAGFTAMALAAGAGLAFGWGLPGVWWGITGMILARGVVLALGHRRAFSGAR